MSKRIKVDDLPDFDAAPYLTDILETNDAGLLASALGDIARARHERDCQVSRDYPRSFVQGIAPW